MGESIEGIQKHDDKASTSSSFDEEVRAGVERRRKVTEASVAEKDGSESKQLPAVDTVSSGHAELNETKVMGESSFAGTPPLRSIASQNEPASRAVEEAAALQLPSSSDLQASMDIQKTGTMKHVDSYQSLEDTLKHGSTQSGRSMEQPSSNTGSSETSTSQSSSDEDPNAPPRVITVGMADEKKSSKKSKKLRRGKWTTEEEAYVARVIQDFNSGFLDAPAGTTLRTYLSEKLQCDPMRITKKFTGDSCIGKRVFHPAVRSPSNSAAIDRAQSELEGLEKRWRRRLEQQQRETAKKAAASLTSTGRTGSSPKLEPVSGSQVVTKTASWLDRAKTVLKDPTDTPAVVNEDVTDKHDLMDKMQEVQRLLNEGSGIRQKTVGLPTLLEKQDSESSSDDEPADKRPRTGAEDAEALVGFLRSVRASAASVEGENF